MMISPATLPSTVAVLESTLYLHRRRTAIRPSVPEPNNGKVEGSGTELTGSP